MFLGRLFRAIKVSLVAVFVVVYTEKQILQLINFTQNTKHRTQNDSIFSLPLHIAALHIAATADISPAASYI